MKFERINCPLCEKRNSEIVFDAKGFRGQVYVSICRNDGMLFLSPRWTGEEYRKYYQEEYYKTHKREMNRVRGAINVITRSRKFLPGRLRRVLDVGAGMGWLVDTFKTTDLPVGIMEVVESDIQCQKTLAEKGCRIISNEIDTDWHLSREGRYEFVVLRHVLEHTLDPVKLLKKINYVLSNRGVVYIAVPNTMDPIPSRTPGTYFEPAHTYYFSMETLETVVAKAGLEPIYLDSVKHLELFGVFMKAKGGKATKVRSTYKERIRMLEEFKKRGKK